MIQDLSLILDYGDWEFTKDYKKSELHSVAKLYAVLPFYDVKCLCSGGQEWGREESHSH